MAHRESPRRKPRDRDRDTDRDRDRDGDRDRDRERARAQARERERERRRSRQHDSNRTTARRSAPSSNTTSGVLSADSLAKLNQLNEKAAKQAELTPQKTKRKRRREIVDEKPLIVEKSRREHKKRRRREVSGALLEEGQGSRLARLRGGVSSFRQEDTGKRKKCIWIAAGVVVLLLAIIIPVAIVVSNKKNGSSSSGTSSPSKVSSTPGDVPTAAKGTYLDPATWADTTDFNTTYTNETVGGLPIMGLNTAYDDSKSANSRTPAINKPWGDYSSTPARGVNLGGWLSLEPFITPSLFDYDSKLGIIDEWTLCEHLGASGAAETLEKHYSTFVTEQTFADIANAGLDHVRIPYSYWAVAIYDGDPYVFRTSWRYLLRAIEWARKYGLRINLDLHGIPGSQNGWNHSGRQGAIGWLNGTDGSLNAQRSLDIHKQLATFFAQDRYKNILAFYGLVNEPKMTALSVSSVLDWTTSAYKIIRTAGVNAYLVFGDGFRGLAKWQGELQGYDGLVLDVHQYVIFNVGQIVYPHKQKVTYACQGWTQQADQSMDVTTGFGPTLFAEWSQADTDCAQYLNNVNVGNRWTGTYNSGDPGTQVLSPTCPTTKENNCECDDANADPSDYSDTYKQFLQMFAEAQMHSFEQGWGWFYWTWKTESAPQWSYEAGLAAGILPKKAYAPDFNCSQTIPAFDGLAENY